MGLLESQAGLQGEVFFQAQGGADANSKTNVGALRMMHTWTHTNIFQ